MCYLKEGGGGLLSLSFITGTTTAKEETMAQRRNYGAI